MMKRRPEEENHLDPSKRSQGHKFLVTDGSCDVTVRELSCCHNLNVLPDVGDSLLLCNCDAAGTKSSILET